MTTGTITGAASEQYEAASTDAIRRFRIHVPDEHSRPTPAHQRDSRVHSRAPATRTRKPLENEEN